MNVNDSRDTVYLIFIFSAYSTYDGGQKVERLPFGGPQTKNNKSLAQLKKSVIY